MRETPKCHHDQLEGAQDGHEMIQSPVRLSGIGERQRLCPHAPALVFRRELGLTRVRECGQFRLVQRHLVGHPPHNDSKSQAEEERGKVR